jgi:hypothetical protein
MKQLILLLGACCLFITLSAEIRVAPNLTTIYEEIHQCSSNTLFLIDIGGTLLIPKDPALHVGHHEWRVKWFKDHYPNLTSQEKIALIYVLEDINDNWLLTDNWPDLIKQTYKLNINTVAFTKVLMDPSREHLRVERLKQFGLVFQDVLNELPNKNELFTYGHGVIQTGQKLKGPALKEVLSKLKKLPMKILFVDDRLEQLKSVEDTCKELHIPFIGFHYTAFETPPYLDEAIAHKQLEFLVKEHQWLSYEKAASAHSN